MPLGLCRDALLRRHADAWIVSNPRLRHHVELDQCAADALIRYAAGAGGQDWIAALRDAVGWDRTIFAGADGLWADQTGLGPRAGTVGGAVLVELLRRRLFLVDPTDDAYARFIAPLDSLLDRAHLGTYHQRVGQHVMADLRRPNDWRWWHEQKFSPDGLTIREGPYHDVEEYFFDDYFRARVAQQRILDFGCGNGHFSARFARYGASVTGIDTSPELIALARANHGASAEFLAPADASAAVAAIEALPAASYDRIYLSDVLLLLVDDAVAIDRLLVAMRGRLRPSGVLHTMEPNGAFWLAGRYGDPERPYAIVPEYRRPVYNVAPTLDRVVAIFARNGFALTELLHPTAAPSASPALRAFAAEYPLWDFCTFALH